MRDRLFGLRHHTVIGSNHQNNDIGRFRATCTHRSKCFVTRRIKEGDHAARCLDVVSTNVLRNATRFACGHFGATNIVEQRGLAVIDVTHHRDNWCARQQLCISGDSANFQQRFRIIQLGRMRNVTHFFNHDHRGLLVKYLVDSDHLTKLHQLLDDLGCFDGHLVRKLGNSDGFWDMDFTYDRFSRLLEIRLAIVLLRLTTTTRTGTPAITTAGRGAPRFQATGTLFLVLPGRRHIGGLD